MIHSAIDDDYTLCGLYIAGVVQTASPDAVAIVDVQFSEERQDTVDCPACMMNAAVLGSGIDRLVTAPMSEDELIAAAESVPADVRLIVRPFP